MTLREEVLKYSGLTEELGAISKLVYPKDIFELVSDQGFYLKLKDMAGVNEKAFKEAWNKLDELVSDYESSKTEEIAKLVHKVFALATGGKTRSLEDDYASRYYAGNKKASVINKYKAKAADKSAKVLLKYDDIEKRILDNLNKADKKYREYYKG